MILPKKGFIIVGLTTFFLSVVASAVPDAGSLLRDTQQSLPPEAPALEAPLKTIQAPPKKQVGSGPIITVTKFVFSGNAHVPDAELQVALKPYIGQKLSPSELKQLTNVIATLYRKKGLLAQVTLSKQKVKKGVVHIVIVEGKLGKLTLETREKTLQVQKKILQNILNTAKIPTGIVNMAALQSAIQIIEDYPGVSAVGILAPGSVPGSTDVLVRVSNTPLVFGTFRTDNFGSRSTGYYRGVGLVSIDSPLHRGEQWQTQVAITDGSQYGRFSVSFPLGYNGTRTSLYTSALHYTLGTPFKALQGNGRARVFGGDITRPVVKSNTYNLRVTGSLERKYYQDEQLAIETDNKQDWLGIFQVGWDKTDHWWGRGISVFNVALGAGHLNLAHNQADLSTDSITTRRQGYFKKVNYSVGRSQNITSNSSLWMSVAGQKSFKNLDSSEKFSLGGPMAVRAYPVGEASGDSGVIATAEWRYQVGAHIQGATFFDYGRITQNNALWDGWNADHPAIGNTYALQGVGAGLRYFKAGSFDVSGQAAIRLGDNPAEDTQGKDNDGTHLPLRVWAYFTKYF